MKSKILEQDRAALVQLNRLLSPEERLVAFYHHSQLLSQLSSVRQENKKQDENNRSRSVHTPSA